MDSNSSHTDSGPIYSMNNGSGLRAPITHEEYGFPEAAYMEVKTETISYFDKYGRSNDNDDNDKAIKLDSFLVTSVKTHVGKQGGRHGQRIFWR